MQIISAAQCRAARALLNWSQPVLAAKCGLHVQTISYFEKGAKIPSKRTLEIITKIFYEEGISFLEADGIQRRINKVITYEGEGALEKFQWDVYNVARTVGGEICVSNIDETEYGRHLSQNTDDLYLSKMTELKKIKKYEMKVLIKENDYNFIASDYADYKWLPKKLFGKIPFYVYGSKLAFLFFEEDTTIHIIEHPKIAEAQRIQFNLLWDQALIPPKRRPSK